ncbi:MAG: nucleotidyl transferase AbiEii/AbiGii toxin family protein [Candidatus Dormiibacterota bacterium]
MSLPPGLRQALPGATARAWEKVAPLVPEGAYLAGGTAIAVHLRHRQSRDLDFFLSTRADLGQLRDQLSQVGQFVTTMFQEDTLDGTLDDAKVQFLLADSQRVLEPMATVGGIQVAGLGDLLATKLKVIGDRGEMRDYFDIMVIEQQGGRRAEEGLALFVQRYSPTVPEAAIDHIVKGLGYFGDVPDDIELPVPRETIERYWIRRQPEIVKSIDDLGGKD